MHLIQQREPLFTNTEKVVLRLFPDMQGMNGWLSDLGDLRPPFLSNYALYLSRWGYYFFMHQEWGKSHPITRADSSQQRVVYNMPESCGQTRLATRTPLTPSSFYSYCGNNKQPSWNCWKWQLPTWQHNDGVRSQSHLGGLTNVLLGYKLNNYR